MRIQVTQEHIEQGLAAVDRIKLEQRGVGIPYACPVAQALNSALLGPARATALGVQVWTDGGQVRRTLPCPIEVADWMNQFDAGQPVEPFEFELGIEFAS